MTSTSTPRLASDTVSRLAATSTTPVLQQIRSRPSPFGWLVAAAPPARLATLRILVGAYATAWAAVRVPAHLAHADQVDARWQPVGLLAPLGSPPADGAILAVSAVTPLLGLLFVVGWRYRAIGPLFAAATLTVATLDSS
jgi:hypothetical protein